MKQQPEDQQRKRSKRHRMKRNNISNKDRVASVIEFGIISRQWEKDYRARYPKNKNIVTL